jgi:hypothetical protein
MTDVVTGETTAELVPPLPPRSRSRRLVLPNRLHPPRRPTRRRRAASLWLRSSPFQMARRPSLSWIT